MLAVRKKLKSIDIFKCLSALRMLHLSNGCDVQCLSKPLYQLFLVGKKTWDNIRENYQAQGQDPLSNTEKTQIVK